MKKSCSPSFLFAVALLWTDIQPSFGLLNQKNFQQNTLLSFSISSSSSSSSSSRQQRSINAIQRNVATDDNIQKQQNEQFTLTPPSKYPTNRGTTVDSRQIIATGAGRLHLTAVRLAHILFASEVLAESSLHELRKASLSFEELAKQISLCSDTRDKGGSIGWVTIDDQDGTKNEHLDLLFPNQARVQAIHITTKPGDIVLVQSHRGYHLVQVQDVMADVKKMSYLKQRKKGDNSFQQGAARVASAAAAAAGGGGGGIHSGAFGSDSKEKKDLTYKIETMGCQMNLADSERIEGQLQSMGIRPLDPEVDDKSIHPDVVVLNTCSIREHAESKV
jgi:hypothetical protein